MRDFDVELPDGRAVSVAEYGDPAGRPVLHLHGAAGCRFEAEPMDGPARKLGVRIISLDRPGVGRSSDAPDRTIVGYGHDVGGIADALSLDKFIVSGFSNGGMYALAAAHVLGERVSKVVPINPTTPATDPTVRAVLPRWARWGYATYARFPRLVARAGAHQGIAVDGLMVRFNPDREVISAADTQSLLNRINAEPRTPAYATSEVVISLAQPWGFDHLAIAQRVQLFSGERDGGRPYAEIWASRLPNAALELFRGGHMGHFAPRIAARIVECFAAS